MSAVPIGDVPVAGTYTIRSIDYDKLIKSTSDSIVVVPDTKVAQTNLEWSLEITTEKSMFTLQNSSTSDYIGMDASSTTLVGTKDAKAAVTWQFVPVKGHPYTYNISTDVSSTTVYWFLDDGATNIVVSNDESCTWAFTPVVA